MRRGLLCMRMWEWWLPRSGDCIPYSIQSLSFMMKPETEKKVRYKLNHLSVKRE